MHDFFKAFILGIVESVTEFLPVSSTGHLILVNQWISFDEPFTTLFDIVIQLGAILAVAVCFRKALFSFSKNETFTLWKKVIISVFPSLVIGALCYHTIEKKLFNPWVVAMALVAGGIVLLLLEKNAEEKPVQTLEGLNFKTALLIGFIQCIAMIPGTSRSAATIIGAMLLGCSRVVAAEFSFFLAIPTMVAASGYSLLKLGLNLSFHDFIVLNIGFWTSFFMAWVVIECFLNYVRKKDFRPFAWYRIVLGSVILFFFFLK